MAEVIDPEFGTLFLATASNFYRDTVETMFHRWWNTADDAAIAAYVDAIENDTELSVLVAEGWLAPAFSLSRVAQCPPGSLGAALHRFVVDNGLAEHIAENYRALSHSLDTEGALRRMPPALRYKVLRGHQTHDLHHVVTGYPATPLGELSIQAFELAQMNYPYAAMWIATVTTHFTFVDPKLIRPAMDAIADGWAYGRRARNIQFVRLEDHYNEPLETVRARYGLTRAERPDCATPARFTPDLLVPSLRNAA